MDGKIGSTILRAIPTVSQENDRVLLLPNIEAEPGLL